MSRHVGRRGRSNPGRGGGGRGGRSGAGGYGQDSSLKHNRMSYMLTSLLGQSVQVQKDNGEVIEGILSGYNRPKMSIVLEAVHRQELDPPDVDKATTCTEKEKILDKPLSVQLSNVVHFRMKNVDLSHTTNVGTGFRTDTQISNAEFADSRERALQRWDDFDGGDDSMTLDSPVSGQMNGTGWGPEDMFSVNEKQFNVQSTYDASMKDYTTELVEEDTEEFRERRRQAERTASEIERNSFARRIDDAGRTEEEKYSSVPREYDSPSRRRKQQEQAASSVQSAAAALPDQVPSTQPSQDEDGEKTEAKQEMTNPTTSLSDAAEALKELTVNGKTAPKDSIASEITTSTEPAKTSSASGSSVRNPALEQELRTFSEKFVLSQSSSAESQQETMEGDAAKTDAAPTGNILTKSTLNPNAMEFMPQPRTPTTPTMAAAQQAAMSFSAPAVSSPSVPVPVPFTPPARVIRPQRVTPPAPIHIAPRGPNDLVPHAGAGMVTAPMTIMPAAANPMAAAMIATSPPPQHQLTTMMNPQLSSMNTPPQAGTPPPASFYSMHQAGMMQPVLMPQTMSYVMPGTRMVQSQVPMGVSPGVAAMHDPQTAMMTPAGTILPQSLIQGPQTGFQPHMSIPAATAMNMATLGASPPAHLQQAQLSGSSLMMPPGGQAGIAPPHVPNLRQPYGN